MQTLRGCNRIGCYYHNTHLHCEFPGCQHIFEYECLYLEDGDCINKIEYHAHCKQCDKTDFHVHCTVPDCALPLPHYHCEFPGCDWAGAGGVNAHMHCLNQQCPRTDYHIHCRQQMCDWESPVGNPSLYHFHCSQDGCTKLNQHQHCTQSGCKELTYDIDYPNAQHWHCQCGEVNAIHYHCDKPGCPIVSQHWHCRHKDCLDITRHSHCRKCKKVKDPDNNAHEC